MIDFETNKRAVASHFAKGKIEIIKDYLGESSNVRDAALFDLFVDSRWMWQS